jgi:ribosomal protein L37AE/L43A|tara:strand:- start:11142 stop:11687 length:546 start_codon:yes stop_codon:yes gene_type:complete
MAGYSRENQRQNEALQKIMDGGAPEKRVMVGYEGDKTGLTEKEIEERKISAEKTDVLKEARMPWFCPKCDRIMKKRIDNQYYRRYNHCMDCQIEFENELAVQGKLNDHIKETVKQNKKSYLKEMKQSIEEWKKAPDTVSFFNQVRPDGYSLDEEQWDVDKDHINQEIKEAEEYIKKLEESI